MLEARWLRSGLIAVLVPFALSAAGHRPGAESRRGVDAVVSQPRGCPTSRPTGPGAR